MRVEWSYLSIHVHQLGTSKFKEKVWGLYDFVNSKECESMTLQRLSILQYTWCMLIVGVQCLSMKNDLNPTYNHLLVWDWKWSKEPLTLFLPLKFCSRHSDFSRSGNLCPFYQSGVKCGKRKRHLQTWDLSKKLRSWIFSQKFWRVDNFLPKSS